MSVPEPNMFPVIQRTIALLSDLADATRDYKDRIEQALARFERAAAEDHLATLPPERREQLMKEWGQ